MHWSAPVATSVPGRALTFGCCRLRCRTGRSRRSCHVEWTGAASANVPRSMHAGSGASSNHLYPSPSSTCSDSNCLQLANRRSILVAQPRDAPQTIGLAISRGELGWLWDKPLVDTHVYASGSSINRDRTRAVSHEARTRLL